MTGHPLVRRVAGLLWVRLPRTVLRFSRLGGVALADGGYLRAWPPAAAGAPIAAALLGLALGMGHPGELYSYSLVVVGALGVVAALGASLGCWSLLGFVVGDLLLSRRDEFSRLALSFSLDGLRAIAALLLSYVLLAGLLVLAPVVASVVRIVVRDWLEGRGLGVSAVGAIPVLTQMTLAFLWTQSTPFLIRPVWSYFGSSPEVPAIEPLQQRGWIVALVVGVGVGVRLVLEARAAVHLDPFGASALAGGFPAARRWWMTVAGRTLFVTFMLSGFMSAWWVAAATAAALAGIFVLQIRVLPSASEYVRVVTGIPLIVRVAAVAVAAYGTGTFIVQRAVDEGSQSFGWLIIATLAALTVVAFLLPEQPGVPTRPVPKDTS